MTPSLSRRWLWLIALACCLTTPAAAQRFEWGRLLETTPPSLGDVEYTRETPTRSATDTHGSTYVTGTFRGTTTIGDTTLTAGSTHTQAYVAKFDSTGALAWVVTMRATTGDATGGALALDGNENPTVLIDSPDSSLQVNGQLVAGNHLLVRLTRSGGLAGVASVVVPMTPVREDQMEVQRMLFAHGYFYCVFKSFLAGGTSCFNLVKVDAAGQVQFIDRAGGQASLQDHKLLSLHVTQADEVILSIVGRLSQPTDQVIRRNSAAQYDIIYPFAVHDIQEDAQGNLYFLEDSHSQAVVTKCTAAGVILWQKQVLTTTAPFVITELPTKQQSMYVAPTGEITVLVSYRGQGRSGAFMLPAADSADLAVVQLDADGDTQSVLTGGGPGEDVGWLINPDGHGNLYLYGTTRSTRALGGLLATTAPMPANGRGFLVKINSQRAQVSGLVYLDANANGRRDPGEAPFGLPVTVADALTGLSTVTNPATGTYTWAADTGHYQLQLPVPTHYALTQGSAGYQGHLASYGQADTARHFGLVPVAGQQDLRVTLTPYDPARRVRNLRYRARVENVGTTTIGSGRLAVQLDPAAAFVGALPAATQQAGPLVQWDFLGLAPRQMLDFEVILSLPATLPMGAPVLTTATVTPLAGDVLPTDNADSVRQVVIGSYDPNDLTVNPTTLTPAQVQQGTPLDYTIRFQNLGTDTAFSVLIVDTLPSQYLRLNTLQLIGSSHNVVWRLTGDVMQAQLPGIRLPYRAIDSTGSQGFIRFRVTPRSTLAAGTLIPNQAYIFFDFNAPIATNEASTLVLRATGLPREPAVPSLGLYPNPATASVTLSAAVPTGGPLTVQVLDALGRVVREEHATVPAGALLYPLPLNYLPGGLYVIRLTLPDGARTSRKLLVGADR